MNRLAWLIAAALLIGPGRSWPRCCAADADSEVAGVFAHRTFQDHQGSHPYVVYLPSGYTVDRRWPVILFLHGAGERGDDGQQMLRVGLGPVLSALPQLYPAIVVFPQAELRDEPILTAWSADQPDGARALQILKEVERDYAVDTGRRILTGWSMGGYGAWRLAAQAEAGFWSAVLPVSGGCDPETAATIPAATPVWAIHGETDHIVPVSEMTRAVQAAEKAARNVRESLVANVGHDAWKVAYGSRPVAEWLLDPSAIDPADVQFDSEAVSRLESEIQPTPGPFVAQAVISRAIAVRISNSAFGSISRGIPEAVPAERLRGSVKDIVETIDYGNSTLSGAVTGVQWTTRLERVEIHAETAERLRVRVWLRELTLAAEGCRVQGGPYSANSGPFQIVIGRWRPVCIDVATRLKVVDGAIRLGDQQIQFSIPDDNWIVTEPEILSVRGPDLTSDLVKIGVVGGVYRAKSRVEESVRELIPQLIARVEERLKFVPSESLAGMLWPLPTIPPPIRLRPEAIRTDRGGVSLTLAVIVGRAMPATGRRDPSLRISTTAIDEQGTDGISVGIAPDAVSALAEAFTDSPESRLDVRDAPDHQLARLADPELLVQTAPDLQRFREQCEFRTQFVLAEPFQLHLENQGGRPAERDRLMFRIEAPQVLLQTSRRQRGTSEPWTPCVRIVMTMSQNVGVQLAAASAVGRQVQVHWGSDPAIDGRAEFADQYRPLDPQLDVAPVLDEFREAWTDWSRSIDSTSTVKDLSVGSSRLRLDQLCVRSGRAWLQLAPVSRPVVSQAEAGSQ